MYCITFTFLLLCLVPFWVQLVTGCDNLCKLHFFNIFVSVFTKILCVLNIASGLYWVAHQCRHFQAPVPKLKRDKCELNQKLTQSAPLIDEYTTGLQIRQTLVFEFSTDTYNNRRIYTKSSLPTTKTAKTHRR